MPKQAADPVSNPEEFLLPHERDKGESVEGAAQSLFDAMESAGLDDLDHPEGDDETEGKRPRKRKKRRDPEPKPEFEEDEFEDDLEEDDLGDEEDDFEEDFEDDLEDEGESDEDDDSEHLITVTLPGGKKIKVTEEEAAAGYSRTQDYTRKRQRDAEEHRAEMESLRERRELYDAKLAKLTETLESLGPEKPDPELKTKNPGQYALQMQEYRDYQDQLSQITGERGTVDEDRLKEYESHRAAVLAAEKDKLFEAVPEWGADPEIAAKELGQLAKFAIDEYGFTQEQLDSVADHRLLLMLRENKAARDRRAGGRKKLEQKKRRGKRLQPGSRAPRRGGAKKAKKRLRETARRTGSLRDHARLLELEMGDDF